MKTDPLLMDSHMP